jgi:hypothetical protein
MTKKQPTPRANASGPANETAKATAAACPGFGDSEIWRPNTIPDTPEVEWPTTRGGGNDDEAWKNRGRGIQNDFGKIMVGKIIAAPRLLRNKSGTCPIQPRWNTGS